VYKRGCIRQEGAKFAMLIVSFGANIYLQTWTEEAKVVLQLTPDLIRDPIRLVVDVTLDDHLILHVSNAT